MEVERGELGERPWGVIFGALALDHAGCELLIEDGTYQYRVAFERNAVIAADSPLTADSAMRVALTNGVITSGHVPVITKRLASEPGSDTIDIISEIAGLPPDHKLQLRRRVIAQAATRTFAVQRGTYRVERAVTLRIHAHTALDIRAVVYSAARNHIDDERLAGEVAHMGSAFMLDGDVQELAQYGVTTHERPALLSLQVGATPAELISRHPELGARGVHALIYALVSCRGAIATAPGAEMPKPMPMPVLDGTGSSRPGSTAEWQRGSSDAPKPAASTGGPVRPSNATLVPPSSRTTTQPVRSQTSPVADGPTPRPSSPTQAPRAATASHTGPAVRPTPSPTAARARPLTGSSTGPATALPNAAARPRASTTSPAAPAGAAAPAADAPDFQAILAGAKESYALGVAALKRNDLPTAVAELHKAATATKDPDHIATFVWAQFCAAPDKESIAKTVRNTLSQSIMKSEKPEIARYFLGRVERMLGREKEALQMFKSVVELDPRHAEALAEIRAIEARLASDNKSFFQRKR